MKAQTVKNAVIVPVGAKGGFVVKQPPADRDALAAEVEACYRVVHRRAARRHRQPRRRRRPVPAARASCATTATTPISSSRPTRAPRRSPTSPTRSRSRAASGSATRSRRAARRLRPQGDGHHRARRVGVGEACTSAHLGIDRRPRRLHRRRHRRHVGRRVRQRHAAVAPHPARRRVRPPARVPRPRPRSRDALRRNAQRLFELPRSSWDDYDRGADLRGWRRLPAVAEVDADLASALQRSARHHRRRR